MAAVQGISYGNAPPRIPPKSKARRPQGTFPIFDCTESPRRLAQKTPLGGNLAYSAQHGRFYILISPDLSVPFTRSKADKPSRTKRLSTSAFQADDLSASSCNKRS